MGVQFYDSITDFIFIDDEPQQADIIFVPGGNYPEAAQRAAKLYRGGYAPYVLPSGRYSILKGKFEPVRWKDTRLERQNRTAFVWEAEDTAAYTTECDYLSDILLHSGVPESAIIREDRATFTYENAIYSRKRVEKLGLSVKKAIVCCQAFHARRCLLYYQEQFPKTEIFVCPVVTRGISRETWHRSEQGIDTVLGEVQRCGSQFHEILRSHMRQNENGMCKNDRRAADDTLRRE